MYFAYWNYVLMDSLRNEISELEPGTRLEGIQSSREGQGVNRNNQQFTLEVTMTISYANGYLCQSVFH